MRSESRIPASSGWRRSGRWAGSGSSAVSAAAIFLLLFTGLISLTRLASAQRNQASRFTYVGGTESAPWGCVGELELTPDTLIYKCGQYTVKAPYSAIETMQFRDDIPSHIRRMKVKWAVKLPPGERGNNKNHFFIVLYRGAGGARVLVFDIPSDQMRPYLAELDLKVGRRVEVQSHENYEP